MTDSLRRTGLSTLSNTKTSYDEQRTSNLSNKIQRLEDTLSKAEKHLSQLKMECQSIRQQKQLTAEFLAKKSEQAKTNLLAKLARFEEDIQRDVQQNKDMASHILDRINVLKQKQLDTQKYILEMQRRVHQLEVQIGI